MSCLLHLSCQWNMLSLPAFMEHGCTSRFLRSSLMSTSEIPLISSTNTQGPHIVEVITLIWLECLNQLSLNLALATNFPLQTVLLKLQWKETRWLDLPEPFFSLANLITTATNKNGSPITASSSAIFSQCLEDNTPVRQTTLTQLTIYHVKGTKQQNEFAQHYNTEKRKLLIIQHIQMHGFSLYNI
jgi:hypothetical protein